MNYQDVFDNVNAQAFVKTFNKEKHTDETRAKMSESQRRRFELNPMSDETRAKIASAPRTDETRALRSKAALRIAEERRLGLRPKIIRVYPTPQRVVTPLGEFASRHEAAAAHNCVVSNIRHKMKSYPDQYYYVKELPKNA